jgi:hypothetical protein
MHGVITKRMAAQLKDISAAVVAPAPKQSPFGVDKRLTTVPIALMRFIIYSKTNQPLSVCDCPRLQALCEACWSNARLPNSKTLRKFYFLEYQVFRAILQIELNLCKIYYSGISLWMKSSPSWAMFGLQETKACMWLKAQHSTS